MAFHYPNGKPFETQAQSKLTPTTNYGSRGMTLEEEINLSNQYYLDADIAVVHKKPTPIQIVKVDYPKRSQAVIKEAYFRTPSTTDYNGVYRGFYLDFEAKETKNKTSFPLKNFHAHQIKHMQQCLKQDGICFVVMRFVTLKRLFVYPASDLIAIWHAATVDDGRKSIPLTTIEHDGFELTPQLQPLIPYLTGVDWLIQTKRGKNHE
ncbi:Holliday junction resolvase RecU [Lacticaseibacillus saniviri]|uniref:Holliday junction resolvase RecU n=1 Tax=Lacticaseibacillus saniviri JCM 17471 = DSM 24301 TaxID=1293598 RepID=A0A0R2MXT4_9LACO|nr:Holliday junction resolvase RecU [Lacticaseibacillus saniviri]KRO18217.1 Holliday junction-specific endonuclease [Lacticaseibacillus saniviri JCM 17471 = DSM 24301]MCG4282724.1 Holliday junction resolvase RecU [Lacticaseibacillus saniviri]